MARMLPIGIQTFRNLRKDGCHYVDKTGHLMDLVPSGSRHFLFRPRRFGKSLLVSTLRSSFACERELFEGLAIEPDWNWSWPCPVGQLDLSGADLHSPAGVRRNIFSQLPSHERRFGVRAGRRAPQALHEKTGRRVVVLVDEYDKPVLDVLETIPRPHGRIATICAACVRSSSAVTSMSVSASLPA